MKREVISAAAVLALFALSPAQAMTKHETNGATMTMLGLLPPLAFERPTEAELERFIEVMPDVADALEDADFDIDDANTEGSLVLSTMIDALSEVEGVEQALANHDVEWADFRPTPYRVLVTTGAIVEDVAAELVMALVCRLTGRVQMPSEDEPDELSLSRRVPLENRELLEKYEEELDGLQEFLE